MASAGSRSTSARRPRRPRTPSRPRVPSRRARRWTRRSSSSAQARPASRPRSTPPAPGLEPVVLAGHEPGGQLMLTSDVENYPGFPEGIQGPELMARFRAQAERFGSRILDVAVDRVDFTARPFGLWADGVEYRAQAVIVATGASALWLGPAERGTAPRAGRLRVRHVRRLLLPRPGHRRRRRRRHRARGGALPHALRPVRPDDRPPGRVPREPDHAGARADAPEDLGRVELADRRGPRRRQGRGPAPARLAHGRGARGRARRALHRDRPPAEHGGLPRLARRRREGLPEGARALRRRDRGRLRRGRRGRPALPPGGDRGRRGRAGRDRRRAVARGRRDRRRATGPPSPRRPRPADRWTADDSGRRTPRGRGPPRRARRTPHGRPAGARDPAVGRRGRLADPRRGTDRRLAPRGRGGTPHGRARRRLRPRLRAPAVPRADGRDRGPGHRDAAAGEHRPSRPLRPRGHVPGRRRLPPGDVRRGPAELHDRASRRPGSARSRTSSRGRAPGARSS